MFTCAKVEKTKRIKNEEEKINEMKWMRKMRRKSEHNVIYIYILLFQVNEIYMYSQILTQSKKLKEKKWEKFPFLQTCGFVCVCCKRVCMCGIITILTCVSSVYKAIDLFDKFILRKWQWKCANFSFVIFIKCMENPTWCYLSFV